MLFFFSFRIITSFYPSGIYSRHTITVNLVKFWTCLILMSRSASVFLQADSPSSQSHRAGAVALTSIFRNVILSEIPSLHLDVMCPLCPSDSQLASLASPLPHPSKPSWRPPYPGLFELCIL